MATTTLAITSNRELAETFMQGTSAGVPLDAVIGEYFILPLTFGDLHLSRIKLTLYSLSGAYAAPTPAYDGFSIHVQNTNGTTEVDTIGAERFVNVSTASARPVLEVQIDLHHRILIRQTERIVVEAPILAGAGVTATLACAIRGTRLRIG